MYKNQQNKNEVQVQLFVDNDRIDRLKSWGFLCFRIIGNFQYTHPEKSIVFHLNNYFIVTSLKLKLNLQFSKLNK